MAAKLLEVNSLTKKFGGIFAVYELSFYVAQGESLGLIGPNGSGKTTTFNLIMRELRQDEGEIHFEGREISSYQTHERVKMGISRTYQIPRPFSELTVTENIRVGLIPDALRQAITANRRFTDESKIGASVGLTENDLRMQPYGLSMGNLRRLELARTLATKPRLLLLDEVFAGLTVGEISELSELLKRKKTEGLTYIIVSHDLKTLAPLVDRVVVVNFGQLIANGSFEDVIANQKVKEAYLGK
ncbi:MAG: ATP-binding cassette domain-containing protein [Desulfobacterales bacterium]|jgi:ABC-type branched-subunit amino acid transport system ATPase component